jgi:electron transfer flavoprotein alpha subunit
MILVYIESNGEQLKKSSLEVLTYGKKMADKMGVAMGAICLGPLNNTDQAGQYGASTLFLANDAKLQTFDSRLFTKIIADTFTANNASVLVLPFNQNGKALGPRLSVRLKAGLVAGACALPNDQMQFAKNVFSGKAIAHYAIASNHKIVSVASNSIPAETAPTSCTVTPLNVSISDADFKVKSIKVEKVSGDIPLSEAELVVSAGRGLKGAENWGMIEDCAKILGAATACSRAVADVHWRPHHEHVGQTGLAISPNLYIAVGISGAIQHLAGVSSSKTIVVINTDADAPFFKAADYGIVGDAFEVMPKLNEALRKFKANS